MAEMSQEEIEIYEATLLEECREAFQMVFDKIWLKQRLIKSKSNYIDRVADCIIEGIKDETIDHIVNAVNLTNYFLKDHFCYFYKCATLSKTFKSDVKSLCFDWMYMSRSNVHVAIIDSITIIALAFLHLDVYGETVPNLDEAIDWFMEIFQEHLVLPFAVEGGWTKFEKDSNLLYGDLLHKVDDIIGEDGKKGHWIKDCVTKHNCALIHCLRNSSVRFPIHETMLCPKCRSDDDFYHEITYIRVEDEIQRDGESEKVVDYELLKHSGTHPKTKGNKTPSKGKKKDLKSNVTPEKVSAALIKKPSPSKTVTFPDPQGPIFENQMYLAYKDGFANYVSTEKDTRNEHVNSFFNVLSQTYSSKRELFDKTFMNDFRQVYKEQFSDPALEMTNFMKSYKESPSKSTRRQGQKSSSEHNFFSQFKLFTNKCKSWSYSGYLIGKRNEFKKESEMIEPEP